MFYGHFWSNAECCNKGYSSTKSFNKSPYVPSDSLTLQCSLVAKLASLKKSICWTEQ